MTKFWYQRIFGLIIVLLGFSYSMTSFYNFYDYLFGDLIIANANIFIMAVGLIFPLYTFIFGIHYYFYHDEKFENVNPFIFTTGIMMGIVGLLRLFVNNGIMQFLHYSFSYVMIICSIIVLYGAFRYKY